MTFYILTFRNESLQKVSYTKKRQLNNLSLLLPFTQNSARPRLCQACGCQPVPQITMSTNSEINLHIASRPFSSNPIDAALADSQLIFLNPVIIILLRICSIHKWIQHGFIYFCCKDYITHVLQKTDQSVLHRTLRSNTLTGRPGWDSWFKVLCMPGQCLTKGPFTPTMMIMIKYCKW